MTRYEIGCGTPNGRSRAVPERSRMDWMSTTPSWSNSPCLPTPGGRSQPPRARLVHRRDRISLRRYRANHPVPVAPRRSDGSRGSNQQPSTALPTRGRDRLYDDAFGDNLAELWNRNRTKTYYRLGIATREQAETMHQLADDVHQHLVDMSRVSHECLCR